MTNYEKLEKVLTELFQLDKAELDFGIYRIMNQKRDDVLDFLSNKLPKEVRTILEGQQKGDATQLKKELDNAIKTAKEYGLDPDTTPKVQEAKLAYESAGSIEGLEQEVFSHLASFFKRYYEGGDFISLRRYKKDVYAIPYEGEEVKLHWANHDQYYIKTSENLKNYAFKIDGGKTVRFTLKEANTEQNNNKTQKDQERRFALYEEEPVTIDGDTIHLNFTYEPHKKSVKQDKLLEGAIGQLTDKVPTVFAKIFTLAPTEKNKKRTLLEKHLNDFSARNTFDYFIHKDLGGFLTRELDFYIKNEVLFIDDINTDNEQAFTTQLSKIRALKQVASKIIAFLAQLENFQKKLWLKKKFVISCDYCITLDRIPESYYPEIAKNKAQLDEWKDLFDVAIKKQEDLKEEPYLVLDTKFFSQEFKDKLLAKFDDLDEETNGLMINSDNFHGLNQLISKYRTKIGCVYIDPPYNTEKDRQDGKFVYKDNFDSSSWLTLISNRLELENYLLSDNYSHYISIDENEMDNAIKLVRAYKQKYHGIFSWKRTRTGGHLSNSFNQLTDYVTVSTSYLNSNLFGGQADSEESQPLTKNANSIKQITIEPHKVFFKDYDNGQISDIINGSIKIIGSCVVKDNYNLTPLTLEGPFTWTQGYLINEVKDGATFIIKKHESLNIRFFRKPKGHKPFPSQSDENFIVGTNEDGSSTLLKMGFKVDDFDYPKPTLLLERLILTKSFFDKELLILDYFSGSGTTGHATIKLNREDKGNRKYILVEMGAYFNTVTKPRIQKVIYTDNWKNGKPQDKKGISQMFKYFNLESYEDALNNLQLKPNQSQQQLLNTNAGMKEEYLLQYMLDVESREHLMNIEAFKNPFNYKLNITENNELVPTNIDLVETFNYLIGLHVKQIHRTGAFKTVEGVTNSGDKVLVIWRNLEASNNDDLNTFVKKMDYNLRDGEFDTIYVNGDNNLANLRQDEETWKVLLLEEVFFTLMFDVKDV